jgi:hypothetical protein
MKTKTLNILKFLRTKTMSHQRIWVAMRNLARIGPTWSEKLQKKIAKKNDFVPAKNLKRIIIVRSIRAATRAAAAGNEEITLFYQVHSKFIHTNLFISIRTVSLFLSFLK